jgi:hypothetical protein
MCYVCVMYFVLLMNVLFCKFAGYSHFQSRLVFLRCPCMIDFCFLSMTLFCAEESRKGGHGRRLSTFCNGSPLLFLK